MKSQGLTETRLSRRLFAAFAVTAIAFVLSSVYSNWLSVEIERQTESLLGNALPSITHLTVAVDDLRDFEAATDDYADQPPGERAPAREHIAELRRDIDSALATSTPERTSCTRTSPRHSAPSTRQSLISMPTSTRGSTSMRA